MAVDIGVILAEVAEVAAEAGSIAQAVQGIENLLSPPGGQQIITVLQAQGALILSHLRDIETEIGTLQRTVNNLGNPQQRLQPVTLPDTPPVGYGGASAFDVWGYFQAPILETCLQQIQNAGAAGRQILMNNTGLPTLDSPWFTMQTGTSQTAWQFTYNRPRFHPNLVTSGQDAVTALQSQNTGWTVFYQTGNPLDYVQLFHPGQNPGELYQFVIPGAMWNAFLVDIGVAPPTSTPTAPVWPGLAKVIMGATVNITPADSGLTVPGPMQGVITTISSVPSPIGYYSFDGDRSYVHLGGIAFQGDDGQDEEAQPMTFGAQIICPRAMATAAAAKVRVKSGTTGTITPWTVAS